jgi:AcrR family transcriptional regulator
MTRTLSERRTDFTRTLILETAIDLLEDAGVRELTMRAVAKQAGMSERSMFRYFATREELLDAVASAIISRVDAPLPPKTIAELRSFPATLYAAFEAKQTLISASLRSDIFSRIRGTTVRTRFAAIRKTIDEAARRATLQARKVHGANVCYFLGASTWHYYRFTFRYSFEDTVECADTAITLALDALGVA